MSIRELYKAIQTTESVTYEEAQLLVDLVCEAYDVERPVVTFGFLNWGNCYVYTVDRKEGDVPMINLTKEGLNTGTLAHELAHHIEVVNTGHDTHSGRHRDLIMVIQDRFAEFLEKQ
jgi:hypothetical protein